MNVDRIDQLEKKVEEIDEKLSILLEILNKDVKNDCKKMRDHIDFIETIYDQVKLPFEYAMNKINMIRNIKTPEIINL